MNTRKIGKIFIVLMISLVAFGCGSCANALNSGNDITNGIIQSSLAQNQEQISTIGDSSFDPVRVMRHYYNNTTNSTNSTNVTINKTTNSTTKPKTNGTNGN